MVTDTPPTLKCRVCGGRLTPVYPEQRAHPGCDPEGRTLAVWIANGFRWPEHLQGQR